MKFLERVYPWLLASPVILPVVIWGGLIYPYLVPKTLLFYALSLLTLAVFLILAAHRRPFYYARVVEWPLWIPAALLVLAYIASIFGLGFYHSFWSLYVRGDGLLMLTCAVTDFYLLVLYADRVFADWALRAIAVVSSFVAVYGIGEWLLNGGRIGSLLGNAAFFAGYLGIAFYATLMAAQNLPRAWKRAAYTGAALQLIAIVLTATRGTMLALVLAGLAYLAYIGVCGRTYRTSARVALVAIVVCAGLFVAFRSDLAQVPFAPVARLASIGTNDPDTASRLFIWKNMLGQIAQHPILGVGAEHIDVLFNKFYDPTKIQEEWFDRSHNAFLDYAVQYGVLGFVLYVALICLFFLAARRLYREGEERFAVLATLLAITYAAQNFFVFDTISSFWLLLAVLALVTARSLLGEAHVSERFVGQGAGALSWIVAVILALLIIPCSIEPAIAAYDLAHGYALAVVNPEKSIRYLSNGFALGTYGNLEYGYAAFDMYTTQSARLTGQARVDAYQAARNILQTNFDRYPYDARTALYYAQVLSLAPPEVTVDEGELSAVLTRAIAESPKRAQTWYILVNLSIADANTHPIGSAERAAGYAAAKDLLSRYIALVPTLSEPHFVLAQLDYASGDKAGAANEAALGKQYYKPDLQTAMRAVQYYETVLDLPDAAYFLQQVLTFQPDNTAAENDLRQIESNGQAQ